MFSPGVQTVPPDRNADTHDPDDFQWLSNKSRYPQPADEYEALMAAPFGVEPEVSLAEAHELREVLADAIDKLPSGERWLFEALFIARLSLRFCARVLDIPKTTLARRRDALLAYLRADLENSPLIQERLRK